MIVAVWSLDANTSTYIVSPSSIRIITLQPVQTLAKIFCVEESLSETEFIQVSQGDVIGVVLPPNNAIPIVSSNAGSTHYIMKVLQSQYLINTVQSKLFTECEMALHLYATVGK